MTYKGKITNGGHACAICKKKIPANTVIYFDPMKSTGNNVAHVECFDRLLAERGGITLKKRGKVKSKMDLDPPF